VEYTNKLRDIFSDEEVAYLSGEKRRAPRGSSLPSGMPVWVRRKFLLNAEMRNAQTMPAKQPAPKLVSPVVNDSDQLSRRLKLASL
jgi:hypothetical protein